MAPQTQQAITALDTIVKQNGALIEALSAIQDLYGGDSTATLAALKEAIRNVTVDTTGIATASDVTNAKEALLAAVHNIDNYPLLTDQQISDIVEAADDGEESESESVQS